MLCLSGFELYSRWVPLFKTNCDVDAGLSRSRVEHCVADIHTWMTNNKLKINENNTELYTPCKYRSRPMVTSIHVGVENIKHQPFVRNFGVILDQDICHLNIRPGLFKRWIALSTG